MIVLAIDTSGPTTSVACDDGATVSSAISREPRGHARVLPGLIGEVLRSAGAGPPDVTHVAVARGPGLFTGMRVGLVAASMFAFARGLPVAGVSTLDALALRVCARHRPPGPFAVLTDARRGEVFAACFGSDGAATDSPRALSPQQLRGADGIPAAVPDERLYVDAAAPPLGVGTSFDASGAAVEVAALAARRWLAGEAPQPLSPIYVRRPDTTAAGPARSVLGRA